MKEAPNVCHRNGPCFARNELGRCSILTETWEHKCPFRKPQRNVTKGKTYSDRIIKGGT